MRRPPTIVLQVQTHEQEHALQRCSGQGWQPRRVVRVRLLDLRVHNHQGARGLYAHGQDRETADGPGGPRLVDLGQVLEQHDDTRKIPEEIGKRDDRPVRRLERGNEDGVDERRTQQDAHDHVEDDARVVPFDRVALLTRIKVHVQQKPTDSNVTAKNKRNTAVQSKEHDEPNHKLEDDKQVRIADRGRLQKQSSTQERKERA